jgi:hypothetical protein
VKIRYLWRHSTTFPSLRMRVLIPGKHLGEAGLGHDLDIVGEPEDCDVLVLFKHHPDNPRVAEEWSKRCAVVFDICDDHFDDQMGRLYRATIKYATHVTCTTKHLQERIWQVSGVRATLITDPYEWPEAPPKKPTAKLLWYGTGGNLPPLLECVNRGDLHGYDLLALGPPGKHSILTDWSQEAQAQGFSEAGMVILPTKTDNHGKGKGPNRMVDAIRQGLYVVATPLRSYAPYGMWQGDIKAGIEWALENPRLATRAVKKAQKIVRTFHDPEHIARQWAEVLSRAAVKTVV